MSTVTYGPRKVRKLYEARDVAGLLRLLTEGKESAAAASAHALGRLGGADVVDPLVEALSDRRYLVRSRAVEALEALLDVEALLARVGGELITSKSLGAPARARLIEGLAAFLGSNASDFERATAATALGKTNDRRAVEPLLAAVAPTWAGGAAAIALCGLSDPVVVARAGLEGDAPRGLAL